jgi:hypothetical protein
MRRTITLTLAAVVLALTAWAVRGAAAGSTAQSTRSAAATMREQSDQRKALYQSQLEQNHQHQHPAAATTSDGRHPAGRLASQLAAARLATAKYATSLRAAKADGYQIITRMIPDMGWHFLNPTIQGFDVRQPPILVYERHGNSWQLAAFEWVFPTKPATPPLPGATYGSFGAACHYTDGTFVFARTQELCATRSPQTGARFNFWHPDLVTLHVWLWYPNPDGLYNGTNPYIQPFNHG